MKTIVLLDLDRTSFRTDQHFDDFCALIERRFSINVNQLKEHEHRITEKPGPYSPIDDIRYSEDITVDPIEVLEAANNELKMNGVDYLFSDVKPFIEWHKSRGNQIVLITVGTHEYQEHKRSLVPLLQEFPIIITRDTKAHVLQKHLDFGQNEGVQLTVDGQTYAGDEALLIDDRAGTFKDEMPSDERLKCVRIKRADAEHSDTPTPAGIREITSLTQLIQD